MTLLEKYNAKINKILDDLGIKDPAKRKAAEEIYLQQFSTSSGTDDERVASLDKVDTRYVLRMIDGTSTYKVVDGKAEGV